MSADPGCPDCGGCGFTRKGSDCRCLGRTDDDAGCPYALTLHEVDRISARLRDILSGHGVRGYVYYAWAIADRASVGMRPSREHMATMPDAAKSEVIRAIEEARV